MARLTTSTEYNMDCLEELQWVVSKTIDSSVARKERIVGCLWAVFAFLGSYVAMRRGAHPAIVALLFVAGLCFLQRLTMVYRSMARKAFHGMSKDAIHNRYALERSCVTATNASGEGRYPYANCVRLLETGERFHVIFRDGQAIVLDKKNVRGGSPEDMKRFLESHCGQKAEFLSRRSAPSLRFPG